MSSGRHSVLSRVVECALKPLVLCQTPRGRHVVVVLLLTLVMSGVHAQQLSWVRQFGDAGFDGVVGVELDGQSNVYVAGFFDGTVDFDPGPGVFELTSASSDAFVLKLDSAGGLVWAARLGGPDPDFALDLAFDESGNVYTIGQFAGTADFDPTAATFDLTSAGASDVFVSKLDGSGNFVWARQLGGPMDEVPFAVAVDEAGSVFTVGAFLGTADFDPGPGAFNLSAPGSNLAAFVSKLDSFGEFGWARQIDSASLVAARGVAVDSVGNVYHVGEFDAVTDFDPGPGTVNLTPVGFRDVYVSKLDAVGDFVWARSWGGPDFDSPQDVALDGAGAPITVGRFGGGVDFDPGAGTSNMTSAGASDGFISKLDSSGNFVWARQFGGTLADQVNGVAVDASGGVYATGAFQGTADFDPGAGSVERVAVDSDDAFVAKLTATGEFQWVAQAGGLGPDIAVRIFTKNGAAVAAGRFESSSDFDPGAGVVNLTSGGLADGFVWKLDSGCGNGVVDPGEECDDDDGCCSESCLVLPPGVLCDDGDPCTIADSCDMSGQCQTGLPTPCNDDVPADDGDGTLDPCTGGISVDCDDNCPEQSNPNQEDGDGDGVGDVCDYEPLTLTYSDPAGDQTGHIDVLEMRLDFERWTGQYTIRLFAAVENPFVGEFRVNVTLYDVDLGGGAGGDGFFNDVFNDYNLAVPTTEITLEGISADLAAWNDGDQVATNGLACGCGLTFRTAVHTLESGAITGEDAIAFGVGGIGTINESDRDDDSVSDEVDNCPDTANPGQVDDDADGFGEVCDCDDTDPISYPRAPEINDGVDNDCDGLLDDVNGGCISCCADFVCPTPPCICVSACCWLKQDGTTGYEIRRSRSAEFSSECVGTTTSDTYWTDPELPAPGEVFNYLIRAVAPNMGSWGQGENQVERSIPCP